MKKSPVRDTLQYNASAVTVVATRQAEYNLEVPLATTVVPREQFQLNRNYGLDEALSLVPGALVQSRTGNHDVRVLVRGFGARGAGERSNAGTSRGVRFYLDGFPETEPDGGPPSICLISVLRRALKCSVRMPRRSGGTPPAASSA